MMSFDRAGSRTFFAITLAVLALASPYPAHAQAAYPDRPVRIVLPFAGGGGINAARTVIASPPDGYTLALLSNGTAVSVSLFKKLPFDPLKDFTPISSLGFFDFIFTTAANSELKTLADFIAAAKAKPGALNVGTINIGSTQNLSAELFKTATGIDFTIIPYRGTPEIEVSLLQGNVALMIYSYAAVKGNLADGKFRALASSGPVRSESTPNVATVRESGVANYDVVSWNALFAPANTPQAIVKTLNGALQVILAEPEVQKRLLELGIAAKASTPEEISARLKADIDKWRDVIEKAGIPKQ